jgi:hypothetical protein
VTREELVAAAREKPLAPYTLDPQLTFFCPQENLEGLELSVVQRFLAWAREEFEPASGSEPAVLLLMPCQKTKPYTLSAEHLAINGRLLAAGYEPEGPGDPPTELGGAVPSLLSNAPLVGNGLRIDRMVISEPFAYVPYEAIYHWQGELSPSGRYDDPGLFEQRGIEPTWRDDCTTVDGRWGDSERAAYVEVHNRMAEQLDAVIGRLAERYTAVIGYVAPWLTHRTFLASTAEREAYGIPTSRSVGDEERELVGVNDLSPGLVDIVPDADQLAALRDARNGELDDSVLEDADCLDLLIRRLEAVPR